MVLEQSLALEELLGINIGFERDAQGESGGEQPQPTASTAARDAVPPPSSEMSDVGGVAT